ncbi:MAG: AAA family ATPase [Campylobacterota bacterium]|nr:AAA family ATPase [Campylobacterota bacterium]
MFPNFKKNSKNSENNENSQSNIDKNLKMMSISAIVLIVLFLYTITKSDNVIHGSSYYIGMGFLFVLLMLTFALQKYKDKFRKMINKDAFVEELDKAQNNYTKTEKKSVENTNLTSLKGETPFTIAATNSNITFKDVAGISDIKAELEEVVDFLNNPKKYQKYNVQLPKGVLLVGPPGVGKTLIAKAVAGEADVPFFYQSGASFVHIYVGMGAKRVRDLFTMAKSKAPSIIFIDEIDAVGKSRGVGANDEREATLNELLTQMDGFETNSGVMVIAATNKIEVLDEALLRAGRFDRRVFLTLPSKEDRLDILNLYLKNTSYNFDIEKLASDTSGFSSAALSTLVNEALLYMIKRDGVTVLEDDIEEAKQKIQYGKKQIHILNIDQKNILATYQAGKAFVTKEKVNLFENGVFEENLIYPSKTQLENQIKKYLAGSIALEVIKNESYVVFEDEINQAYSIAIRMVEVYKMEQSKDVIIQKLKDELKTLIIQNIDEVKNIKEILLKDEVIVF